MSLPSPQSSPWQGEEGAKRQVRVALKSEINLTLTRNLQAFVESRCI